MQHRGDIYNIFKRVPSVMLMTLTILLASLIVIGSVPAFAQDTVITWYEHGVKQQARMALDEVAVFPEKGKAARVDEGNLTQRFHARASIESKSEFVMFMKSPEKMAQKEELLARLATLRQGSNVRQASPVFYRSQKGRAQGKGRMALTGEIIVRFPAEYTESQIAAIESDYALTMLKSFHFAQNAFLYQVGDPLESVNVANRLYESGQAEYSYPNWFQSMSLQAIPNDPLFPDQWHLQNTGQGDGTPYEDVNIVSVWDTYKGSGTVIAIVDDGLEIGHEDLSQNVIVSLSWDYVENDDDPTAEYHGTAVAGVAAGRGFSRLGITGAAPYAGLAGLRIGDYDSGLYIEAIPDALTHAYNQIDIYNNSWGLLEILERPGDLTEDALSGGAHNGRDGLGNIYVFSGGNGAREHSDSNYGGFSNSRYTIAVAASDWNGIHSTYSEEGANILVNAPSNTCSQYQSDLCVLTSGITTTDRTGSVPDGYDFYDSGNYTHSFSGTSAAAPLVSGIIALMLEANPNLTWRDVQHILMKTATKNDPNDIDWRTNGVGYHINHKYGFGRINAANAVNLARGWIPLDNLVETYATGSSMPNLSIPDLGSPVNDTISISEDITIDFVEVYFTAADHTRWSDLEIILTSPQETISILSPGMYEDDSGTEIRYHNWRFGSVRHFEESSQGIWTLEVRDRRSGDTGTFQSWGLRIWGFQRPEIELNQAGVDIPNYVGNYNFGSLELGASQTVTFTIENVGDSPLDLTGSPLVQLSSGTPDFSVTQQPSSGLIAPFGGSVTFDVTFTPTNIGLQTATVTIDNSDLDESPYTFTVQGGVAGEEPAFVAIGYSQVVNTLIADDGNYIVATSDGNNYSVLKMDLYGRTLWHKQYEGPPILYLGANGGLQKNGGIQNTRDGGYILIETVADEACLESRDLCNKRWLLKLDREGNVIWQKIVESLLELGADSLETGHWGDNVVHQTHDGGYIVVVDQDADDEVHYDGDDILVHSSVFGGFEILRLDQNGNALWHKIYDMILPNPADSWYDYELYGINIVPTTSGEYFVGGTVFTSCSAISLCNFLYSGFQLLKLDR